MIYYSGPFSPSLRTLGLVGISFCMCYVRSARYNVNVVCFATNPQSTTAQTTFEASSSFDRHDVTKACFGTQFLEKS